MCISPAWKLRIINVYGKTCVFLEPGGSGASVSIVKYVQKPSNCKPFLSFFVQGLLREGPAAGRPGSRILTINSSLKSRRVQTSPEPRENRTIANPFFLSLLEACVFLEPGGLGELATTTIIVGLVV